MKGSESKETSSKHTSISLVPTGTKGQLSLLPGYDARYRDQPPAQYEYGPNNQDQPSIYPGMDADMDPESLNQPPAKGQNHRSIKPA